MSFEWERTQFPLQSQTNDKLMPHKKLFDAGQNFMDRYELWMHTQVGIHEPSVIEKEIIEVLKIIAELETVFAENPATLKLTIDVRGWWGFSRIRLIHSFICRSKQLWMNLRRICR